MVMIRKASTAFSREREGFFWALHHPPSKDRELGSSFRNAAVELFLTAATGTLNPNASSALAYKRPSQRVIHDSFAGVLAPRLARYTLDVFDDKALAHCNDSCGGNRFWRDNFATPRLLTIPLRSR